MAEIRIDVPENQIVEFCHRWNVTELSLFGSVMRDDFQPGSDVDFLVSFAPDAHWSLLDLVTMQDELQEIFGREVDLIERKAIEKSENYLRRRYILQNARVIYAAG
jgi:predicted nucleotidyltransferase